MPTPDALDGLRDLVAALVAETTRLQHAWGASDLEHAARLADHAALQDVAGAAAWYCKVYPPPATGDDDLAGVRDALARLAAARAPPP